ncbi:hypothetical protein P692DRAFT_201085821 [Suillus brevipes Sb2]|nr:hypothetical protein P692DRAFT_201085821 [Suillus brevipes Sb2]
MFEATLLLSARLIAICKVVETTLNCVESRWDCPIRLNFDVSVLNSNVGSILRAPVHSDLAGHYNCEAIHETGVLVALDLMSGSDWTFNDLMAYNITVTHQQLPEHF